MYRNWVSLWFVFYIVSCGRVPSVHSLERETRDYVTVGKMMDSIRPPYVIDLSKGKKRLVFIGCDHNNDSNHAQFALIARYALELKPQVSFNEGGQIADSVHYPSLHMAAAIDGETGALKYCADKFGFPMLNGDIPFSTELQLTLKQQTAEDLFLYYIMERFVIPYHYGAFGQMDFEKVFTGKAIPYFIKNGFPFGTVQQNYPAFLHLYKQKMHVDFDAAQPDLEAFDYINPNCHFCAVGRSSKMARDSILLNKIEAAFSTHDRVLVTFGHGHALAIEPALKHMFSSSF